MKFRLFWVPILVLIAVAVGVYLQRQGLLPGAKPEAAKPKAVERPQFDPPPAVLPPPVVTPPVVVARPIVVPPAAPQRLAPEMVLPIQDQATIDFSIGSPVIKRDGRDAEAMNKALKEMEEATRNLTIPPSKPEPPKN